MVILVAAEHAVTLNANISSAVIDVVHPVSVVDFKAFPVASAGNAAPSSTDDVIINGNGAFGNSDNTISNTRTCLSLTVTSGYTGTRTHSAVLTVAGNVTFGANETIAGSSSMTISATSTITSNGKTWPNNITINSSITVTNNSLLTVNGILSLGANVTFAGTNGFTTRTLSVSSTSTVTITLKESITYSVTSGLESYLSRVGSIVLFTSSHASTKAILTLQNGASCNCLANFTRIDASGGRPIRTFFGVITDSLNIENVNDLQTVSSAA